MREGITSEKLSDISTVIKDFKYDKSNRVFSDFSAAPITDRKIKISTYGQLSAQGKNCRLLIRLNNDTANYKSYFNWGGNGAGEGDWDTTGFYVGRNKDGNDCTFSLEYTLTINSDSLKILGSGMANFVDDNRVFGCESHGYFNTPIRSLTSIELIFLDNGIASWATKIYSL
ncbi:hypothetical protein NYE33_21945 [Paenibacillus sp. FSL R10-2199]|uniref:hypothetical protein n=1 Tax=Paenibacillus sp. FSL R10-2199 TaxID=2975348 RepID=UPI0030F8BA11